MTQSVLLFALGFLSALFIGLLLLPSVWRRAVRLTRRGVEATMPLTMEEIVARQDQLRARHALDIRKVEIACDDARRKSEALQVAIAEARRAAEAAAAERGEQQRRADALEARLAEAQKEREEQEAFVRRYAGKVREAEDELAKRDGELERLSGLYEESSLRVTTREVEVARKENEIGRLRQQIDRLTGERQAKQEKSEQDRSDMKAAADALEAERARMRDLERRLATAMREVGDKQAKLARMDNEIDRLKQAVRSKGAGGPSVTGANTGAKPVEGGAAAEPPTADALDRRLQAALAEVAESRARAARLGHEVERLSALMLERDEDLQIVDLQKENLRLVAELEQLREDMRRAPAFAGDDGDRKLRETMHELAAEVVTMAARQGGSKPIERALDMPVADRKGAGPPEIVSLADRIRKKARLV